MTQNKTPLIYLWLYKKMIDRFGKENQIIIAKEVLEVLRRTVYQIPRRYDYYILKEMCSFELLEKVNSQKYKLMGAHADSKLKEINEYFLW
ncbi:MAG: hypothetical protein ACHQ1D_01005 [Nitrososphaerales archaeon]